MHYEVDLKSEIKKPKRGFKGRYLPGETGNPEGHRKNRFTDEVLKTIASRYLLEIPHDEIDKMLSNPRLTKGLPAIYIMILTRIKQAMREDSEGRLSAEMLLDRLIGKPLQVQKTEVTLSMVQEMIQVIESQDHLLLDDKSEG